MVVWSRIPRGQFPAAPSLSLALPVDADRARLLDASYSSHAVDLDGDSAPTASGSRRPARRRRAHAGYVLRAEREDPSAPLFGEGGKRASARIRRLHHQPAVPDIDGTACPT